MARAILTITATIACLALQAGAFFHEEAGGRADGRADGGAADPTAGGGSGEHRAARRQQAVVHQDRNGYNPTSPPFGYDPTRPPFAVDQGYNPTRPPMTESPVGGTLVARLGAYPGHTGPAPAGTVAVTEYAGGIYLKGTLTGLEAGVTGGVHIHVGFTCSQASEVLGHYYEGLGEDPWTTTYTSDANGVASVELPVSGLTLWGRSPVAGRALVLHDSNGGRVGCGLLELSAGEVTHVGQYPGHAGAAAQGTIVTTETTAGILIAGTLAGLPANTTAGFHIHSGFSCDDTAGVGGHYYEGMSSDPWTTTYTSDASGAAQISLAMQGFSLYSGMPVLGHTLVVHNTTARIGCGLVGHAETVVASLGAYPGYSGAAPNGTVAVTAVSDGTLQLRGILTGLEASATGGVHVHPGFTCGDAGLVGGHYYEPMPSDPWTTTYTSDADGVALLSLDVAGFTLSGSMPVAGRALVVHSSTGTRIGCGLLEVTPGQVAHLGAYPGYAGSEAVRGTIVTTQTPSGISMSGTVAGLPASTTAGYHIHAGYSCNDSAGVYGHYFEGLAQDPWTTTYTSDARGAAQISQAMADFSVYAFRPVLGRTLVFHGPTAMIGCGVIGQAETLVAPIGAYPGFAGSSPLGMLSLTETYTGIRLSGVVTGLEASTTGGVHIHEGFTCTDAGEVGGHYYDHSLPPDPWTTTYTSDASGAASISLEVDGFSISDVMPVAGRSVVLHNSSGTRIGCGLLRVTTGQVTSIGVYPGYTGGEAVVGLIVTEDAASGILMSGTLAGLPTSTTAGFHIHSGYTCAAAAGVGGHYYEGLSSDPWTTTYTSDASGSAQISLPMSNFSLYRMHPVLSRAIVVHSPTAMIGCGVAAPEVELLTRPATTTTVTPTPSMTRTAVSRAPAPARTAALLDILLAVTAAFWSSGIFRSK